MCRASTPYFRFWRPRRRWPGRSPAMTTTERSFSLILRDAAHTAPQDEVASIPVMIRLERAFHLDADIVGLVLAQFGQLDADLGEMQPRHLLVQRLRQHIDFLLVLAVLVVGEQFDLRQRLVG